MSQVISVLIFILFGIQLEAAHVEPPTNVTLDCHNLVHVVKWSYTEFSPELRFRIFIGGLQGATKEFFVDSPNLQANFSLDTDPADTFSLTVTAVVGPNESDEVPPNGIQFSYNKVSLAPKKCFMDLPAVNVTTMQDGIALLSFMHPWLLYGHKIPVPNSTKERDVEHAEVIPDFEYDVVIVSKKETSHVFDCSESECMEQLVVDLQEEKLCLRISGEMEKMTVRGTQEYCTMLATVSPAKNNFTYIIYIIVTLLVLIALAFILFMVYQKLTTPSSSLPSSMTFKDHLWRAVGAVRDQVSVPEVEPASPTPLLQAKEFPPAITSSTEPKVLECTEVVTEDKGVWDKEEIGNDEGCWDNEEIGNDEGCGYTHGGNLEDSDMEINAEPSSGYEKRPGV